MDALETKSKYILSWKNIDDLVNIICHKIIHDFPQIDSVHGVKRGGLIPSVLISHKLNLPWTYEILPNTLVVDDICDSGLTLKNYAGVYTAVLHYKPHTSDFKPDMWGEIYNGNEFIYYPWEDFNSLPIADYLKS
jgi:hypoxanthine phosphoribosyltransferase